MKSYSEFCLEKAEVEYAVIEESLSSEINQMIDKNIKDPAKRAFKEVKKRLIKKFAPKIKAWGLANSNMLKVDAQFAGIIKQAINQPEKLIAKIYDSSLENGDLSA